jgi:exopolysaccharide production protein ExoQ
MGQEGGSAVNTYSQMPLRAPSLLGRSLQKGKGNVVDEILVVLWLIFLPLEFPMAAPLRYPVAFLVLAMVVLHWRQILHSFKHVKWFFLLPALCLLSVLWAAAPFEALRFGVLLAIGFIVALYTAVRLDHRQFVVAILISSSLLMLASLFNMEKQLVGGIDGGYAVIGVFPQKNVLGVRMLILSLAAFVVLTDRRYGNIWRLLAAGALLPAAFLLFKAQSATALLLYIGALSLVGFLVIIWRPAARVRGLRPVLVAGMVMLATLGSLVMTNVLRLDPVDKVLSGLGKSTTLTGRTDIWQVAQQSIAENPVLGLGAGNFWRDDVNAAVSIANRFHHEGSQFYFHNAYYEVTVDLGFIGLALFVWLFVTGLYLVVRHWLTHQRDIDPFFIGMAAIIFMRSFTESEMFSTFLMNPMIFWTGVFMAALAIRQKAQPAHP